LHRAREIEEGFLRKQPQSGLHQAMLGRVRYYLGHQHRVAEEWSEVIPHLEAARVALDSASESNPNVVGLRFTRGCVYKDLGLARMSLGLLEPAIPNLRLACELLQSSLRDDPQNLDYLKRYGESCEYTGDALERAGQLTEAIDWCRKAVDAI